MWNTVLKSQGPNAINISGGDRNEVLRAVQQLDTSGQAVVTAPTPFDKTEKEVAKMTRDAYRRFQGTNGFRICALLLGAFGPLIRHTQPRTEAAAVGLSVVGSNASVADNSLVSLNNVDSEDGPV